MTAGPHAPERSEVMLEETPLPLVAAIRALTRCVVRAAVLLARRRVHQPTEHVGWRFRFANGSAGAVYRETVIERPAPAEPAVLVVCFRLRHVRSERAHALFRLESLLNTVLFVGFPGLVSKLWLRHDQSGLYRGLYEWDGPRLAAAYVGALWWVLALVSVRGSIRAVVLPGLRRDELITDPSVADGFAATRDEAWWQVVVVTPGGKTLPSST